MPPLTEEDRQWLTHLWQVEWGGDTMVTRGQVYRLTNLHALVCKVSGKLAGAATYRFDNTGCELMSLNALTQGSSVGTALVKAVEAEARKTGCRRLWLIMSNDNLDALRFYQRRGFRITAVYPDAVDEARRMKPTIPLTGENGIEIHDEIELAKAL